MILQAAITAPAAFFIWHCLGRVRPPLISHVFPHLPQPVQHFLSCPWCAGAWVSLAVTLVHVRTWPDTLLVWLASAALVGITGSLLPDDGNVDGGVD